jgi:hypothetical protein
MRGEIAEDGAEDAADPHRKPVARINWRRDRPSERRERKETSYQCCHARQKARCAKAEPKDVDEPITDIGRAGAQKDNREPVKGFCPVPHSHQ